MEDEFGDDDTFDHIPDNALTRLEQSAISSTQRPQSRGGNPAGSKQPRINTYGVTGLSRNSNASKTAWRPPQPRQRTTQPLPVVQPAQPLPSAPATPSSDYGFDEEDVIDLDEPSMVVHSASGIPNLARNESFTRPPARSAKATLDPETEAAFAAADAELGTGQSGVWAQAPHAQPALFGNLNTDVSALQARIAELEASNSRLHDSEQEARHTALQKAGEIAIVRANHDRTSKEYERRIAVMQKLHADETARQKAELESGRKEREKIETSNRFLQHDLAQEAERAKGLRGTGRARVAVASASGAAVGTPRKDRRVGALGDGFDDDEVVRMVSPSKSKDKSREQTPKVGTKRKRSAQDSPLPAPALSLSGGATLVSEESIERPVVEGSSPQFLLEDERFDFMQKLLHHRPYESAERTMEILTRWKFPSNTTRTMATMLTDGLSSSASSSHKDGLPLRLAQVALQIWSQCLQERFYKPIYLLLDLVKFALLLESASTVTNLIPEGVRTCIRTIDLVAATTLKASKYPAFAASEEYRKIQSDVVQHIDANEVMDLLQRICDAATLHSDKCDDFWRTVELTFILQMLQKAQPLSQITAALQMLSTSALETSFGPICPSLPLESESEADTAQKQTKQEKDLLDRLTSLLLETPVAPSDEPAYADEEVQELRIEILHVFKALCSTDHGSMLLAQHRNSIGRLIKFLEAQVNRLYSISPSLGLDQLYIDEEDEGSGARPHLHDLTTTTINITIRILSHLLQSSSLPTINLQQKVSIIRGGWHKFLISFTRIAFSDQLVLEAGIENEVVEAAHSVLDQVLSPEEGEAVMRAVETPRGTKGSAGWDAERRVGQDEDSQETMAEDPG